MSSSFPLGWEKLDSIEWGLPYEASQSGQGSGRGSIIGTSRRDHGGGGGISFRDRSDVNDGRPNHSHVADKCELFMMKTELIALCIMDNLISCDPASYRKIYNEL